MNSSTEIPFPISRPFIDNLEPFLVSANLPIIDAVSCIDCNSHRIALVVDDERRLIDTITDGDIRRAMLAGMIFEDPLSKLLDHKRSGTNPIPLSSSVDMSDDDLLHLMNKNGLLHIPLVDDDNRLVDLALLSVLAKEYETNLRAVIMAGGFGTRLMPLTEEVPKPMLPIGGRPLMERILNNLQKSGVKKVNITTHYRPEMIVEHFGSGDDIGFELNYTVEDQPLGTAGALGLIDEWDDPLLVINGDILTTVDFRTMLDFHKSHKSKLTVGTRHFEVPVPYGVIECEGVNITDVKEKPNLTFFVNAGIYLIEPDVCKYIPRNKKFDMTDLIDLLIEEGENVVSFPIREYWLDIGKHEDYLRAQEDVKHGRLDN
jgi:dTDP-glucose pyrophosphorylase/CBS domain-containing protein